MVALRFNSEKNWEFTTITCNSYSISQHSWFLSLTWVSGSAQRQEQAHCQPGLSQRTLLKGSCRPFLDHRSRNR